MTPTDSAFILVLCACTISGGHTLRLTQDFESPTQDLGDAYWHLLAKVTATRYEVGKGLANMLNISMAYKIPGLKGAGNGVAILKHDEIDTKKSIEEVHHEVQKLGFTPKYFLGYHTVFKAAADMSNTIAMQNVGAQTVDETNAVNLCMTSILARLTNEEDRTKTLVSLLESQDYGSNIHVFWGLPPTQKRETETHTDGYMENVFKLAKRFKDHLVFVNLEEDYGPASRYMACRDAVKNPKDLVIGFDDDLMYDPKAVSALVCAKKDDPEHSYSGMVYKQKHNGGNRRKVGQGADGILMTRGDLEGLSDGKILDAMRNQCFRVDDVLISRFLKSIHKPLKQSPSKCSPPSRMWQSGTADTTNEDSLQKTGTRRDDTRHCHEALDALSM